MIRYSTLISILVALVIFGYPITGAFLSFVNTNSTTLSYPIRGITLALALMLLFTRSKFNMIDKLLLVFIFFYTLRLIYDLTIADILGADIALIFFYGSVVVPLMACASNASFISEEKLQTVLLIFGTIFVILIIQARNAGLTYNPWEAAGIEITRVGLEALNPISIGRAAGALIIVGVFVSTRRNASITWRLFSMIAVLLGLYVMLLANSRGPILALLVTFIFIFITRPIYIILTLVGSVSFFMISGLNNRLINDVLDRFSVAGTYNDGASEARYIVMVRAWEAFIENPILGYHYIDPTLGLGLYPHNLILESAMALGIIGLVIFITLITRTLSKILLHNKSMFPTISALFIYYFICSNFSGSIWGSQEFFVTMVLSSALVKVHIRY